MLNVLKYLNNEASHVNEIWKVINWAEGDERYKNGVEVNPLLRATIKKKKKKFWAREWKLIQSSLINQQHLLF
jgi:hypothetical protein